MTKRISPLDLPEDFDGCSYPCRKTGVHTLQWSGCSQAPESARPEPRLTVMRARVAADGYPSLVGESISLSELMERIEKAMRTVPITLGPNSLKLLENGHQMHLTGGEYSAMALAVAMDLIEESK